MLIKYKVENDIMLTEISDVSTTISTNSEENAVVFTPLDSNLMCIMLSPISSMDIDIIVNDLFINGKADITAHNVTLVNPDEDEEIEEAYEE